MAFGFGRFIFEGVAVIPLCRTSGSQWFPLRVSQYPRFWGFHSIKVALDFGILWDFHMNESRKMKGYFSISKAVHTSFLVQDFFNFVSQ